MIISRRIRRIAAALASGLGMGFAQPDWGLWPLSFVSLIPLLWAMRGVGLWGRVGIGWCFGTAATMTTPWLPGAVGFSNYFGLPVAIGGLAALGVAQLFGAVSMMLFAGLAGDDQTSPLRSGLHIAGSWITAEWLRCVLFSGLPWMLLAHSLQPVPMFAQLASWGGVFSVSGALVLCNVSVLHIWSDTNRRQGFAVGAIGLSLLTLPMIRTWGPLEEGAIDVNSEESSPVGGSALHVSLIQGSLPSDRRLPSGNNEARMARLVAVSRGLGPVDLVVWPESAMTAVWPANRGLLAQAMQRMDTTWLLLGAPRSEEGRLYNAAVLVGSDAAPLGEHDKVRLLPFAERAPWPLAHRTGDLTAGTTPTPLELARTTVGPLICYEILFEDLARAQVEGGANVLVNLSNEAWFASTGAMRQNLAAAVFRGIEVGRPVLRATNSGLTVAIDARGRVVAEIPPDLEGGLSVVVQPAYGKTIYYRFGHWFPIVVALWVTTAVSRRLLRGP